MGLAFLGLSALGSSGAFSMVFGGGGFCASKARKAKAPSNKTRKKQAQANQSRVIKGSVGADTRANLTRLFELRFFPAKKIWLKEMQAQKLILKAKALNQALGMSVVAADDHGIDHIAPGGEPSGDALSV